MNSCTSIDLCFIFSQLTCLIWYERYLFANTFISDMSLDFKKTCLIEIMAFEKYSDLLDNIAVNISFQYLIIHLTKPWLGKIASVSIKHQLNLGLFSVLRHFN